MAKRSRLTGDPTMSWNRRDCAASFPNVRVNHFFRFAGFFFGGADLVEAFLAEAFFFVAPFSLAFIPATPPTTAPIAAPIGPSKDPAAAPAAAPPAVFRLGVVLFVSFFLDFAITDSPDWSQSNDCIPQKRINAG